MRRSTVRIVSALIPLLAILLLALPAQAVIWCKTDPIVKLNGTQVQILVSMPEEYVPLVNGPTSVTVATPLSVTRQLIYTDAGFNGYGEAVSFTDLRGNVKNNTFATYIRVQVPIDRTGLASGEVVPVQVEVIPDNAKPVVVSGTSDSTQVYLAITGR